MLHPCPSRHFLILGKFRPNTGHLFYMNLAARTVKIHPFIWFCLVLGVLYAPAWRAGFVTDAIDWLNDVKTLSFRDYLNQPHSTVHSLYQLTQLTTLGLYKLFGTARLPWHLTMI